MDLTERQLLDKRMTDLNNKSAPLFGLLPHKKKPNVWRRGRITVPWRPCELPDQAWYVADLVLKKLQDEYFGAGKVQITFTQERESGLWEVMFHSDPSIIHGYATAPTHTMALVAAVVDVGEREIERAKRVDKEEEPEVWDDF